MVRDCDTLAATPSFYGLESLTLITSMLYTLCISNQYLTYRSHSQGRFLGPAGNSSLIRGLARNVNGMLECSRTITKSPEHLLRLFKCILKVRRMHPFLEETRKSVCPSRIWLHYLDVAFRSILLLPSAVEADHGAQPLQHQYPHPVWDRFTL